MHIWAHDLKDRRIFFISNAQIIIFFFSFFFLCEICDIKILENFPKIKEKLVELTLKRISTISPKKCWKKSLVVGMH
jgi:hypothetical protein